MPKHFVSNKDESVRMFKNDFLDKLSRIHWSVPLFIYIPLIIYFIYKGLVLFSITIISLVSLIVFGFFLWTLTEYLLHRFIFHYQPKTEIGKKMHFMFHGVHHDYPQDSWRLVMVPAVSLPLAILFYYIFQFLMGEVYTAPFFAGFLSGYLFYDMAHYSVHHFAIKNRLLLKLKANHMKHHYLFPDMGFSVSNTFWDKIFGTTFPEKEEVKV